MSNINLFFKTLSLIVILSFSTITNSFAGCMNGSRITQGTGTFINGNCRDTIVTWEYKCPDGKRLIQGTTVNCQVATSVEIGNFLGMPTCPLGKRSLHGTNDCSIDVPTVTLALESNGTVVENAQAGEIVGTISILHTGNGTPIEAIILQGEGSDNFEVSTDGTITVAANAALDFETVPYYYLVAKAKNSAGESSGVRVNITITDYDGNGTPFQIEKLQATPPKLDDWFGQSIAMDGQYVVVGAPGNIEEGGIGSAYLFKKSNDDSLIEVAKLQADDSMEVDNFGNAVAISGDYIVVGAEEDDSVGNNIGSAYLFRKSQSDNAITQITKIEASDFEVGDKFGHSIAIDGEYIVISAIDEDTQGTDAGSVYIFKLLTNHSGVEEIAKIQADDIQTGDKFGSSVSINGKYIVVGAKYGDTNGTMDTGAAYIFKIDEEDRSVTQIAKLPNDQLSTEDYFGNSVSISHNYVVVGAYGNDTQATDAGASYLYKISSDDLNITLIQKIYAYNPSTSDNFGKSVSLYDDYIVIGSDDEDSNAIDAGSAYVYKKSDDDNLSFVVKLQASDLKANDHFGNEVCLSGDTVLVGSYGIFDKADTAGSVYLYDIEPYSRLYIYNETDHIEVIEGIKDIYTIDASSPVGEVTYTLDGIDSDDFILIENQLSFATTTSFENPTDDDLNNIYQITLTIDNGAGHSKTMDINITVSNQNHIQTAKIQSNDIEAYDRFGSSIAVSGEYIVIGAEYEDTGASKAGSAYLFKKLNNGSIVQTAKINPSDPQENDFFGSSVAISNNLIVIGAYGKDTPESDAGSAYLFRIESNGTSVTQLAQFQADDANSDDFFGYSVAIDGDNIVVGAQGQDSAGSGSGRAYLFRRLANNSVQQINTIQHLNSNDYDGFGYTVSISGDYIAVSANEWNRDVAYAGSVYLFKMLLDGLSIEEITKLKLENPRSYDHFGDALSISGEFILVGAYGEDSFGDRAGSAYLYKKSADDSSVRLLSQIIASDTQAGDNFGYSVALKDRLFVIGARNEDTLAGNSGSAYIFELDNDNTPIEITKIRATDAESEDAFGSSVAIDNNLTAVGAYREDTNGIGAGSVYIYHTDED